MANNIESSFRSPVTWLKARNKKYIPWEIGTSRKLHGDHVRSPPIVTCKCKQFVKNAAFKKALGLGGGHDETSVNNIAHCVYTEPEAA